MRIEVNLTLCASTGACTRVAPELFALRDGVLVVLVDEPAAELQPQAQLAEELCPTGAISLS